MAFKLNRPFSLGKYVKLRVNKKSVGLQVGGKYLKGTINTKGQITGSVGGAGTGMYLQKTKNLKNTAKCEAITKTGKRCSRNSSQLSGFCSQHKNFNTVNNQVETNGLKKITAVIDKSKDGIFILSDKSEKELIDDYGGQSWIVPLGIILSGIGLSLILKSAGAF